MNVTQKVYIRAKDKKYKIKSTGGWDAIASQQTRTERRYSPPIN